MNDLQSRVAQLTEDQRRRLAQRLDDAAAPPRSARRAAAGPAPLSFAQQRLWFLDQLQPGSAAYNVPLALRLTGPLDVSALERALNEVCRRHDVLRTRYEVANEQPVQVVVPFQPMALPLTDLTQRGEQRRQYLCERLLTDAIRTPFSLSNGPPLRASLLRLRPDEYVLQLVLHHIATDAWSCQILKGELVALYAAFTHGQPSPLPDPPLQYADYAAEQRAGTEDPAFDGHLAYWKDQLGGAVPRLDLPTDRARPAVPSSNGARLTMLLPDERVRALTTLAQRHQATPFMAVFATFAVLLHRLTGQEDIIVGAPVAGRTRLETEKMVGLFLNPLALRTDLSGKPTFAELLGRVRNLVLGALGHQDLPFERLVEELHPERSLGHTPLFQVMLNMFMMDQGPPNLPGLQVEEIPTPDVEAKFDLTLYVRPAAQGLRLDLVFSTDLFDRARAEEMLAQFTRLVEQIVAAPGLAIQAYSLVTERARALLPDPTIVLPSPRQVPVVNDILRWAEQTPTQKAVTQASRSWTYAALTTHARQVALLLAAHGLRRGDVVALTGPRSFALIASVVGVAMSGGVMLTIDHGLPAKRQGLMLDAAAARYLLYVGAWRPEDDWLREMPGLTIIAVAAPESEPSADTAATLPEVSPGDPAYIFFTSGTTGVPKGVLGCHQGLSHFVAWQRRTFDVGPRDRCAQLTNLSFDVVLRDIFLPLTSGATLCLPDEAADPAAEGTLAWLEQRSITLLHVVPTLAQTWLGHRRDGLALSKLRWTFFAGEALTETLVQRWRDAFPEAGGVVNLYGPTETTLAKCFHTVPALPSPGIQPVGASLPESQALVLTESGQLCGVGERGEIAIRTPFRTLGYINAPSEQRQRFVPTPFRHDPCDLLYLTGDRGRYRPDGGLEILGRVDDQAKIRGVRVEPGEVTALLAQHQRVKACYVSVRLDAQGDSALVAYVVPVTPKAVAPSDLRSFLAARLPAALVPTAFVFLSALPLSPNGKIDRQALPEPNTTDRDEGTSYVAPRTPVEHALADIWRRVLKHETLGVNDDFFDLGGHSLTATQIVSQIRREFGVDLPLHLIFARPTIAGLAQRLLELQAGTTDNGELEQLLNEVDALTDEAAEDQLRGFAGAPAPGGPSTLGFPCPTTRSARFGNRECNLIIVINERFEMAGFERLADHVRQWDPTVHAVVVHDALPMACELPPRPTLTFSPAAIRHCPPHAGQVFAGYPLAKSEEYRALARCDIPVPRWATVTADEMPGLSGFGEYVVRKPDYGGRSAEVRIVRRDRVRWKPITTRAGGTSESLVVQEFVYTGPRPVSYRVQTLFGRVLYAMRYQAGDERPLLASPEALPSVWTQQDFSVSAALGGSRAELSYDEEVIRLAERAHAAFPSVPLLGFDIVRELPSGRLYVLEANAIGYTWNFTAAQPASFGFSFEEQFDGVRKAAWVLADKTQECAR